MRTRSKTFHSLAALAGMTALAALGCNSSGNGDNATSESSVAPATASATSSAAAPDKIRVIGSINSVSGSKIEVSGSQGSSSVEFSPSTKIMELSPLKLADITAGACVTIRPASGAEGGTVHAEAVVVGVAKTNKCEKSGSADNAGLPPSSLGGFRGTVDSVTGTTIALTTYGADGSKVNTTVETDGTTMFADRHKVGADAIVEGKCIIAGGHDNSGGTLKAESINLPMVVDGKCPAPKGS